MATQQNSDIFGPRKITINDILINSLGVFISGIIGSILIIIIIFMFSFILNIEENFKQISVGFGGGNPVFPFILSFITFLVSIAVCILNYYFLSITDSEKYKKTSIHFGQISFFAILIFIFFAPIYVYIGINNNNNIMYVFIIHMLILFFGEILLIELFNNYRYILVSLYASFVGLLTTTLVIFFIFSLFGQGYAKLLSLLLILPLINFFLIFFKGIFEYLYYYYFKLTGYDQLGDILQQIKTTEEDELKQVIDENSTY